MMVERTGAAHLQGNTKKTLRVRGIVLLSTKRSGRSNVYSHQVQNNETPSGKAAEYKAR